MSIRSCFRGGFEGRPGIWIGFDYDPRLVTALKTIPHTERSWEDESKLWWVSDAYEDMLRVNFPGIVAFLDAPQLPGFAALR